MIELAQFKLQKFADIEYHVADLCEFEFDNDYDAVVSSLAMHHLPTDQSKKLVYEKIYNALKKGGVFYNADTVLGSTDYLDNVFIHNWKEFMLKSLPIEEIEDKWLPQYYEEDFPSPLMDHIDWLREVGFRRLDVVWKYYKGAVFGGLK